MKKACETKKNIIMKNYDKKPEAENIEAKTCLKKICGLPSFYFVHFIVEWIGLRFFAIQINSSANLHRASNMSSYINQYYFLREFPLTYHDTNQGNHSPLRTFLRSHFFFVKNYEIYKNQSP